MQCQPWVPGWARSHPRRTGVSRPMFCQVPNCQNGADDCWDYQKCLPHLQDRVLVLLFLFVLVFLLGVLVHAKADD